MDQVDRSRDHLLELSIDCTVVVDEAGVVLAASESCEANFGYSPEVWIGRSVLEVLHPEDAAAAARSLEESASRRGRMVAIGVRVRDAAGRLRPVELVANSLDDPVGVVVLSVRDHTEAEDAAQRLDDRSAFYRQVVEMAAEGVWMIDSELRTTFATTSMSEMLGVTVDEMLGRCIYEFMDAEGRELAEANFVKRVAGDREPQVYRLRHRTGRVVWVRVNLMELAPQDSESTVGSANYQGSVAVVSDITDAQSAKQELALQQVRQQALLDAIPDLVFHFDSDGVYLDYAGSRDELAMDPEDFLGRTVRESVPPEMAEAVMVAGSVGAAGGVPAPTGMDSKCLDSMLTT